MWTPTYSRRRSGERAAFPRVKPGAAAFDCVFRVEPDFFFAASDDQTDEDLFRALPKSAFPVRAGIPHSRAAYHLKDHLEARELLWALAADYR